MGKENAKGKLSSIILSALSNGDKYGFEIISEIEKQTCGAVVIKQPSLYSSLKRMEDQDLISSYWMDSEIGGRRHYYRLTDYGRKQLEQWKKDFDITKIQFAKKSSEPAPASNNAPTFLQQENLFDIQEQKAEEKPSPKPFEDDAVLLKNDSFIQYNLFEQPTGVTQANFLTENKKIENSQKVDENTLLNTKQEKQKATDEKIEEKPYDIFAELDLFRNSSKSFAGSMSNSKPKQDYHTETLKSFMGESFAMQNLDNSFMKQEGQENVPISAEINFDDEVIPTKNALDEQEESETSSIQLPNPGISERDEGTLITERYVDQDTPKVKKIDPPTIDVFASSRKTEIKRETKPNSYDEKIGELYRKNNQNATAQEVAPLTISNYSNLKKYFAEQKISFNIYQKSDENKTTQTSLVSDFKFSLIRLSMTFLSLVLSLIVCFVSIKHLSHIPNGALALYIVPPVLYLSYAIIVVTNKAKNKDRKVLLMETNKIQLIIKISLFVVFSILTYVFNLAGGLNGSNFNDFTNTTIVPFVIFLHIPLTSLFSFITTKFKCIK